LRTAASNDEDAAGFAEIAPDAGVACVLACHEDAAGGSTDRGTGVALGETGAFGGEVVYTGGFDFLLSETAKVGVAEVVGHDKYDIGFSHPQSLWPFGFAQGRL
jgi:hypothetical protein